MAFDPLSQLPRPNAQRIAIRVEAGVEPVLRTGHPWLYAQAITSTSRDGSPGDIAVVFDRKGRFLAAGLYDPGSQIRVRLLVHGRPQVIDRSLFRVRLAEASSLRLPLAGQGTNGYRLVHGANDGLAGLVVDRYDQTLVVKLYSAAWLPHLPMLVAELTSLMAPDRVVLRLSRQLSKDARNLFELADGLALVGQNHGAAVPFSENGLVFEADVIQGQKTGFFLDQRENRQRVEGLAIGRSVLNVFSYSGAFSLYAARGGAAQVTSVDQSRSALEAARRHFAFNEHLAAVRGAVHETLHGDAFTLLPRLAATGERFDMVILDPPAFARRHSEVPKALRAYRRLLTLGVALAANRGVLVASSCSSQVTADMFFDLVNEVAQDYGRPLIEIERTGHALDHPIRFKEGAYLKTLFATVV